MPVNLLFLAVLIGLITLIAGIYPAWFAEQRMGRVLNLFTGFAILISCLGLFGLSIYIVRLRVREIGIRKVLGASMTGITTMLSKDFVTLVLIAICIALPMGWWIRMFCQKGAYQGIGIKYE